MKICVIDPITTPGIGDTDEAVLAGDDCELVQVHLTAGPASIESDYDVAFAAPGTIVAAIEAENDGADAVVINCMSDPALSATREAVRIPVVGAGQAAFHVAALLAHSFSVLVVEPREISQYERNATVYGLESKLRSVRSIDIPVLDLASDLDRVARALNEQSALAIENDGAHALVLGCTGMHQCAIRLERLLRDAGYDGVPVVEPVAAAIKIARALVELGLTHSKRTYPLPPATQLTGYDFGTTRAPVR